VALFRAYRRFFVVAWHFLPLVASYARDRHRFIFFGSGRRVSSEMRVERATTLLNSFLTLGPTFIKLGQLLSTRPDVLPPEYVDVFTQLQDRVPPAPWEEAEAVIEAALGPVDERFESFDTDAISGASLGQVYRAEVDGRPVAVKVRRPGIEALVEADLRVIRWSLPFLLYFVGEARSFSLENLADEFAKTIREEMDYEREARMLTEIRGNFADDPGIAIPAVVPSHSGPLVLTMEYIGGTKINEVDELDTRGIDRHAVAERLQRAYMKMLIEDGIFHADPHPGNLAVQDDGTIVFYDFGMSAHVDEFIQRNIVDFYVAIANQDIDAILDTLIGMGTLSPTADRAVMAEVLELAIQDARGEQIEIWRVNQIISRIEDTIYEFPLRLPSNLALVLRMATVVEGVCVTLDPTFDFIEVATEYLTEHGYREESVRQFLDEARGQMWRSSQSLLRVPPKLDHVLDRLDRNDVTVKAVIDDQQNVMDILARRIILGLFIVSGSLATTILYAADRTLGFYVIGGLTLVFIVMLYRSFTKRRGIRAAPQFTRQTMERRRRGGR